MPTLSGAWYNIQRCKLDKQLKFKLYICEEIVCSYGQRYQPVVRFDSTLY